MSTHAYSAFPAAPAVLALTPSVLAPAVLTDFGAIGDQVVFTFTPDLTAAQAATLDRLVKWARSGLVLTWAEFEALQPDLAALRTFRQQTQAEFMALTAAQRDRALFDQCNALAAVIRALLRD